MQIVQRQFLVRSNQVSDYIADTKRHTKSRRMTALCICTMLCASMKTVKLSHAHKCDFVQLTRAVQSGYLSVLSCRGTKHALLCCIRIWRRSTKHFFSRTLINDNCSQLNEDKKNLGMVIWAWTQTCPTEQGPLGHISCGALTEFKGHPTSKKSLSIALGCKSWNCFSNRWKAHFRFWRE
jgi:hypothetical protein